MKALESLLGTPFPVPIISGMGIVLRGRADAENLIIPAVGTVQDIGFDPRLGLALLGLMLISGAILIAREMRIEARQVRQSKKTDELTRLHPRMAQHLQRPQEEE